MIACENSGHSIPDDFPEVRKIVEAGVTTNPKKDYELSRYACYLIVQNGDPRKEVIALGQTYFAIQTYRQEVADHFNDWTKITEDLLSWETSNSGIKCWQRQHIIQELLRMRNLRFFKMPDIWDYMVD